MKHKLSIIIPTYNGGNWIQDSLESVLCQINEFKDRVEFLVRDNNSNDRTGEIVEDLNKKYGPLIKYDKRSSTVDADVNFREAIMMTDGEFVLLLGDDDLLFPNYINATIHYLDQNPNIGLLYYNRIATSREYEGSILKHKNPCKDFIRYYKEIEDFIRDYPTGPDFMSVNVVRRECILKGIPYSKSNYYGVEWYAAILFGLQGYTCISVFYPMVLQRAPSKRMWDDRALLYVVVGVDNLFTDVSKLYPSAHQSWLGYAEKNVDIIQYLLKCIPLNRNLYKSKWGELVIKLSRSQRFLAYILIHFPFLTSFLRNCVRYYRLFSRLTNKILRKCGISL